MDNTQGNPVHLCTFLLVHTFPVVRWTVHRAMLSMWYTRFWSHCPVWLHRSRTCHLVRWTMHGAMLSIWYTRFWSHLSVWLQWSGTFHPVRWTVHRAMLSMWYTRFWSHCFRLVAVVRHISSSQVDSAQGNAVHVVHTFL